MHLGALQAFGVDLELSKVKSGTEAQGRKNYQNTFGESVEQNTLSLRSKAESKNGESAQHPLERSCTLDFDGSVMRARVQRTTSLHLGSVL